MNAYFCLFNNPYTKWAKGAIQTFLNWHPDWEVECFVVNTVHDKISGGIFNDKRVHVHFIDKHFLGFDKEKEFCNSQRFVVFQEHAHKYDKIITTDVDCLFKKTLTEIDTALDTNDICMYIDDEADQRCRAGASFLAYKPNKIMTEFWDRYQKILNGKNPFWYNDQIALYDTYKEFEDKLEAFLFPYEKYCFSGLDDEGLCNCEVIQPRGDKNSLALSSYRQMVDYVLSLKPAMNVLILGSGLSGRQVSKLDLSNHFVIAINNAWELTPNWTHHIYPDDFTRSFPTDYNQIQQTIDNTIYMKKNTQFGNLEFRGNSMIYNALYYAIILNPKVIGTLGCDLYYDDEETHFYKGGTKDPLRFQPDYHKLRFKRFLKLATMKGIECVNYSGETRGLNPFTQKTFPYVTIQT